MSEDEMHNPRRASRRREEILTGVVVGVIVSCIDAINNQVLQHLIALFN